MDFDITSFFEILVGNMQGKDLSFIYYIITLIALSVFFAIRDFLLVKKEDLAEDKRYRLSDYLLELIVSMGISICCILLIENILVSIVFSILATLYFMPKISAFKSKKKKDDKEESTKEKTVENNNNVNIVVNNNLDNTEDDLLPNFYDPNDLKLPENITSFNQLNIIMILEMYGYISPNQKFKMITQSLFETPDEQVEKLLEMYVLDTEELKEARAILNLIRLNNRLISKEEALQCITRQKKKEKEEKGE